MTQTLLLQPPRQTITGNWQQLKDQLTLHKKLGSDAAFPPSTGAATISSGSGLGAGKSSSSSKKLASGASGWSPAPAPWAVPIRPVSCLQIGHFKARVVLLHACHLCVHSWWNTWAHGVTYTGLPSSSGCWQIAQSLSSNPFSFPALPFWEEEDALATAFCGGLTGTAFCGRFTGTAFCGGLTEAFAFGLTAAWASATVDAALGGGGAGKDTLLPATALPATSAGGAANGVNWDNWGGGVGGADLSIEAMFLLAGAFAKCKGGGFKNSSSHP